MLTEIQFKELAAKVIFSDGNKCVADNLAEILHLIYQDILDECEKMICFRILDKTQEKIIVPDMKPIGKLPWSLRKQSLENAFKKLDAETNEQI